MKKHLILLLLALVTAGKTFAQLDAQAKTILSQVSQKYKAYNLIKTDFTFSLDNPQAGVKDSQSGSLIAKPKTGKFKVTINGKGNAINQEITSDGKNQWTYLKKDNEVQVNEVDKSGEGLNPAQIFTIYEKGFKYLYTGDQKLNGKLCQVIDLSPTDAKRNIFKVRLFIDKAQKQIYSATIFDKSGSRITYTLKSFNTNLNLPESTFTFDAKAHPGVEVVDLR
ncbi:outer membrane lipoprotein carrier protein LolA [Mucilaginibacter sp. RS28]|uniref:Outer membrane lipoprotein carrier protein LolA n=1 Tax=Mucilaginibacter straminoryzae TaxID=2932774 RepID=A0A9X2BB00_9SPHI|nr:outer membrane lipoprotein carrier protein LolA [Mucilaginibacter straminoryzae]MCJ8209327.1 outer membrane lipoprotein carrier protein LolA [Mucilaginibacter straminoryzae]